MIIEYMFFSQTRKYFLALCMVLLVLGVFYFLDDNVPANPAQIQNTHNSFAAEMFQPLLVEANSIETTEQLEQLIQGKWRAVASKDDTENAEYQWFDMTKNDWLIDKIYLNGSFHFLAYKNTGELYEAYGGRYEVVNATTIVETIEFYAPYNKDQILWWNGTNGSLMRANGYSRVGSILTATVKFEDNVMYQVGLTKQNLTLVEKPDDFKDIYTGLAFKKVLPWTAHSK
jgi:hypothetical protein